VGTGVLFLVAMWFSPLASVIPAQATAPELIATAPALIIVGLVMPFTWSITNGIGAGFVTYVAIKLLNGRGGRVHWMLYLAAAFVVYFALPLLERRLA
jgi:AGZA family xanthine/uracil permease-like MFS transporter